MSAKLTEKCFFLETDQNSVESIGWLKQEDSSQTPCLGFLHPCDFRHCLLPLYFHLGSRSIAIARLYHGKLTVSREGVIPPGLDFGPYLTKSTYRHFSWPYEMTFKNINPKLLKEVLVSIVENDSSCFWFVFFFNVFQPIFGLPKYSLFQAFFDLFFFKGIL